MYSDHWPENNWKPFILLVPSILNTNTFLFYSHHGRVEPVGGQHCFCRQGFHFRESHILSLKRWVPPKSCQKSNFGAPDCMRLHQIDLFVCFCCCFCCCCCWVGFFFGGEGGCGATNDAYWSCVKIKIKITFFNFIFKQGCGVLLYKKWRERETLKQT